MLKNINNNHSHHNPPLPNHSTSPSTSIQQFSLAELKSLLKTNPSFISPRTLPSILTCIFLNNDTHMLSFLMSFTCTHSDYTSIYHDFLMKCCEYGKKDLIKTTLEQSSTININTQNAYGDTPLHILCYKGDIECVKEVMKYRPVIDIRNGKGMTALDYAVMSGRKEMVEVMKGNECKCFSFNERDNVEKSVDCQGYAVALSKKCDVNEVLVEESDYTISGVVDNNEGDDDSSGSESDGDDSGDRVKMIQSGRNANSYSCSNITKSNKHYIISSMKPLISNNTVDNDKTIDEQGGCDEEYDNEYTENHIQHHKQCHSHLRKETPSNLFLFEPQSKENNDYHPIDNFNFSNTYKYTSIKSIKHSLNKNEEAYAYANRNSFSKPSPSPKVSDSLAMINKLPSSLIYTPSKPKVNSNSYTSSTTAAIHNKRFNTSSEIFTSSDMNIHLPNTAMINSSRTQKPKQPIASMICSPSEGSLYSFLKEIELQVYTELLCRNGFDDIGVIIEQTKSDLAMTDQNLKDIGVQLIGDRAKILVRLEEKAKLFPFSLEKEKVYYQSARNRNSMMRMFSTIKMEEFTDLFINAGYSSVDLLIVQMLSRQPLSEMQLEKEIGIEKIGYRMRIIHKLKSEAGMYAMKLRKSAVILETRKQENEDFCNLCEMF